MKNLYLIGGAMGTGKSSVCRTLKTMLDRAVFLDGDWCWDMDPFQVTDETKSMVIDNICFTLNNFLRCGAYENMIFCWVLHEQSIIDEILSHLDTSACRVKTISLICRTETLRQRLQKDIVAGIRSQDIIERSLGYLPLYDALKTIKIDLSDISAEKAAVRIARL